MLRVWLARGCGCFVGPFWMSWALAAACHSSRSRCRYHKCWRLCWGMIETFTFMCRRRHVANSLLGAAAALVTVLISLVLQQPLKRDDELAVTGEMTALSALPEILDPSVRWCLDLAHLRGIVVHPSTAEREDAPLYDGSRPRRLRACRQRRRAFFVRAERSTCR
jgi:hypothetical protein